MASRMRSRAIAGSAAKLLRRAPSGVALLRRAESLLRDGNLRDALDLCRTIVNRYPPSLERLAALSYLQKA